LESVESGIKVRLEIDNTPHKSYNIHIKQPLIKY